jgi:hypothetical protein
MNKKEVKRLNRKARRAKHGMSRAKIFIESTQRLRELQEREKEV